MLYPTTLPYGPLSQGHLTHTSFLCLRPSVSLHSYMLETTDRLFSNPSFICHDWETWLHGEDTREPHI